MNSLSAIEKACREGVFTYIGNRQRIAGATASYHGAVAASGHVWVHIWKTGIWDQVPLSAITITTELVQSKEDSMATKVTDISGKRSGKRGGGGHTSLPSESAARAAGNGRAKKGDATSSLKDLGEIVGVESSTEAPTPPAEAAAKKGDGGGKKSAKPTSTTKERKPRSVVTRTSAKQGELPGVQTSSRKVAEIEDLADKWDDAKATLKDAREAFQDADDNLVASMRRHGKSVYSRQTWGKVEVPDPKIHAKFKREKSKPAE